MKNVLGIDGKSDTVHNKCSKIPSTSKHIETRWWISRVAHL